MQVHVGRVNISPGVPLGPAGEPPYEALFIRAPRFRRLGPGVEVLGRLGDERVLVREGRDFAATFHPELTSDLRIHQRVKEAASA